MAQSRIKLEREQMALIGQQLREAGVQEWTARRNSVGHIVIEFYRNGKLRRFGFSGTSDWKARLRNRSMLRGILNGQ